MWIYIAFVCAAFYFRRRALNSSLSKHGISPVLINEYSQAGSHDIKYWKIYWEIKNLKRRGDPKRHLHRKNGHHFEIICSNRDTRIHVSKQHNSCCRWKKCFILFVNNSQVAKHSSAMAIDASSRAPCVTYSAD